jgi:SPP1 gp7 family putative phage head morphogenesis protein
MTVRKVRLKTKKKPAANTVRGSALPSPISAEVRYNRELQKLISRMTKEVEREIVRLFESPVAVASHVATDASIGSQSRILMNALMGKFMLLFSRAAKTLADSMVGQVDKISAVGVARSLKELSKDFTLKTDILKSGPVSEILKVSVAENVGLIKSIPAQFLQKVEGAVMRSITTGNGLQDLVPFLKEQGKMTERRAHNIALDQTRKAYQAINAGRMKAAGVKKFEWVHSGGGQKPRPLHVAMNGNVYSYDNLPVIDERTGEKGIPGQAPNCRCSARPVLDFGDDD